jgi:hypothetical protein
MRCRSFTPIFAGCPKARYSSRFYELRNELLEIFATEKPEFAALIKDKT